MRFVGWSLTAAVLFSGAACRHVGNTEGSATLASTVESETDEHSLGSAILAHRFSDICYAWKNNSDKIVAQAATIPPPASLTAGQKASIAYTIQTLVDYVDSDRKIDKTDPEAACAIGNSQNGLKWKFKNRVVDLSNAARNSRFRPGMLLKLGAPRILLLAGASMSQGQWQEFDPSVTFLDEDVRETWAGNTSNLGILDVSGNAVESFAAFWRPITFSADMLFAANLRYLNASSNRLKVFASVNRIPNLEYLNVSNNPELSLRSGDFDEAVSAPILDMPALMVLDISGTKQSFKGGLVAINWEKIQILRAENLKAPASGSLLRGQAPGNFLSLGLSGTDISGLALSGVKTDVLDIANANLTNAMLEAITVRQVIDVSGNSDVTKLPASAASVTIVNGQRTGLTSPGSVPTNATVVIDQGAACPGASCLVARSTSDAAWCGKITGTSCSQDHSPAARGLTVQAVPNHVYGGTTKLIPSIEVVFSDGSVVAPANAPVDMVKDPLYGLSL